MSIEQVVASASKHGPTELKRIDYLDGWRGLAIVFVLIGHFVVQYSEIELDRLGVDLFFVLSGMLMANILFVKKVDLRTFYKRRISRIMPVFVIFLSSISLASWLFSLSEEHKNFFYNLFFIRSYWPVEPSIWKTGLPIGHLWSLNVEEHSYILLSLITVTYALKNKPSIPILSLGLFSVALHCIYIKYPSIASENYKLKTEIVGCFIFLSAGYFLIKHKFVKYIPSWLPLVTIAISIWCYTSIAPHWTAKWILTPFLLAFSVNHLDLTPKFFKSILSFAPLRLLGVWSFSIYLWQQPLFLYGVKDSGSFTLLGLILMLLGILIGAISFYVIENPARKFLNEKW